jgi:hypothetical protein
MTERVHQRYTVAMVSKPYLAPPSLSLSLVSKPYLTHDTLASSSVDSGPTSSVSNNFVIANSCNQSITNVAVFGWDSKSPVE